VNPRIDTLCELALPEVREYAGLHRYDGEIQDLSPAGVEALLGRLGQGPAEPDLHDEAHLQAEEAGARAAFGRLQEHRRNPLYHLDNLDLAVYDREYAPKEHRDEARRRHLSRWPDAVEAAIEALDRVPAVVAGALLPATRGLAALVEPGRTADNATCAAALEAHGHLVSHLERAASGGEADASVGAAGLAALMGDGNATAVDLGRLALRADAERDRVKALLREACSRLAPGRPPEELVDELARDHPDAEGIQAEARSLIGEATAFTLDHDLIPDPGGECLVGPAPPSRRWAMAMMSWAAPHEEDAPSWYYVTPPDPEWPAEEQEEWLAVFSRTTLPAITVHEVTPGHYAHGRLLRSVRGNVPRTFFSSAFVEGWAHYAEELCVEEGFRDEDPRFAIGVFVEALVRISRLAVAIGLHTGAMDMDEAVHRFEADAFLRGPAARAEATRAAYDPTYGRYTWGKLEIVALRDEARASWGRRYSHRRFHEALLALGAPPLGLMGDALGEH
jgi:hypothetical protein